MRELISNRAFAKVLGLASDNSIRRAIQTGKLSKCLVEKDGKTLLDKEVALKEWVDNVNFKKARTENIQAIERISTGNETPLLEKKNRSLDSMADLSVEEKLLDIELKGIKIKEQLGELVKRSDIDKKMAEHGVIVRMAFTTLPEKIADALFACTERHEVVSILKQEINSTLIVLSEWKNESETFTK